MLDISQPSPGLYSLKSVPSLLWSSFVPSTKIHNTPKNTTITFSASRVETLQQYLIREESMSYQDAYRLVIGLHTQLVDLQSRHGLTIPIFSPLGIIIVDGSGYIADPSLLSPLADGKVHLPKIPRDLAFVPPELRKDSKKELTLDSRISLYSLASLCGAAMFPNWSDQASYNDVVKYLEPIKNTSLYWCLLRCLERGVEDRVFLFV